MRRPTLSAGIAIWPTNYQVSPFPTFSSDVLQSSLRFYSVDSSTHRDRHLCRLVATAIASQPTVGFPLFCNLCIRLPSRPQRLLFSLGTATSLCIGLNRSPLGPPN